MELPQRLHGEEPGMDGEPHPGRGACILSVLCYVCYVLCVVNLLIVRMRYVPLCVVCCEPLSVKSVLLSSRKPFYLHCLFAMIGHAHATQQT